MTNRKDLEGVHEPGHKLVKVRTAVLKRQHGRVHTAAQKAFKRVEPLCKIKASKWPEKERTVSSVKGDLEANDVGDTAPGPSPQIRGSELPACGNCKGALSFPFWYCIFCEGQSPRLQQVHLSHQSVLTCYHPALSDDLFICDSCDMDGVPDLTPCSIKHTEGHHLIRCMPNEKAMERDSPTEQRFKVLEERFDNIETRLGDLGGRMGNIEQLLQRLASKIG